MATKFAAALLFLSLIAKAEEVKRVSLPGAGTLTQSYVWHDGAVTRTVWLDPAYVAEFGSAGAQEQPAAQSKEAVARLYPGSTVLPAQKAGTKLWRLGTQANGLSAASALTGTVTGKKFSPLFRDGDSTLSPMRALPGNIIVYFRPDWTEQKIQRWAESRKLSIVQKFSFGKNIYVLKAEPGLASLVKANEIHSSGEVIQAFPDWWTDLQPL